jgi:hypothetical protein
MTVFKIKSYDDATVVAAKPAVSLLSNTLDPKEAVRAMQYPMMISLLFYSASGFLYSKFIPAFIV